MNRPCENCGHPVVRNPDSRKRWMHTESGQRKCSSVADMRSAPISGNEIAVPGEPIIDPAVAMVVIGSTVYWRNSIFHPGNRWGDTWSSRKQGAHEPTSGELVDIADTRGEDIYALQKAEKL